MIIEALKTKGMIAFPEEINFRIPNLKKIAIIGKTGAGKSSLMDTLFISWFGKTPLRESASGREEGAIYDCFTSRDSFVESIVSMNGHTIHAKRLIDPVSRKQIPYLYIDGKAVSEGKIKEFNEKLFEATKITERVFLSAIYHAQTGKGRLTGLDQKDVRELFDDLLNFCEYDKQFSFFETKRTKVSKELEGINSAIQMISTSDSSSNLRNDLDSKKESLEKKIQEISNATHVSNEKRQMVANLKANFKDISDLKEKLQTIQSEIATDVASIEGFQKKIEANKTQILARSGEIREAELNQKNWEEEEKILISKKERSKEKLSEIESIITEKESNLRSKKRHLEEEITHKEKENKVLSERKIKLQVECAGIESKINETKSKSSLLEEVPCRGKVIEGENLPDSCLLLKDARASQAELPPLILKFEEIDKLITEIYIDENYISVRKLEIKQIDDDLQNLKLTPEYLSLKESYSGYEKELEGLQKKIKDPTHSDLVKLVPYLETAEEKIEDYKKSILKLEESISKKEKIQSETEILINAKSNEEAAITNAEKEFQDSEEQIEPLQKSKSDLEKEIGSISAKLEIALRNEERIADLNKEKLLKETQLGKLRSICEALGPKGARALMVDAAGPEISSTINSILSESFPGVFQIKINTVRESSTGNSKEDFSVTVLDNRTGIESLIKNKSGGEGNILNEAISLGVAVYKRNKFGADIQTLLRDESDGGLDSETVFLYQKMLDRAIEDGRFNQVIFITHKKAIQELADQIFEVKNGKIYDLSFATEEIESTEELIEVGL
ncbi:AAA family ATPase [Leptospira sp. 201903071]|uniref:AAA family ATPase n=1 Tax=Leptospira ainazelensis TaxID=2810034 RepID=UPI001966293D|nr:AAA family ATPase [Leptospira ainazelensis]MBM9499711.1 AAA family ATPase [Leptospira ainazelensis]